MSYINSQTREQIAVLAGIVAYCEAMAEDERDEFKRAKRSLQAMMRHAEKAFNAVVEDVDIDQLASIIHTTKNSQFALVHKSNPRANYDSYIIPTQVFDRLMADVIGECAFCTKQGKEVKKCQKRRDLAKCGIVTDRAGECPYQG